jgi:hypothetical protein
MNSNFPINLYDYYDSNVCSFEERTNIIKKGLSYGMLVVCILLIFIPSIIPFSPMLIRIAAIIGAIIFGFAAFLGGKDYYSKESGGKINDIAIKKFDSSVTNEELLLTMFENNDFIGLSMVAEANDQPLQLYIHEDSEGKVFYLQLMKYFSQSDFRGISQVKVIAEPLSWCY